jgi:hypothetical protein
MKITLGRLRQVINESMDLIETFEDTKTERDPLMKQVSLSWPRDAVFYDNAKEFRSNAKHFGVQLAYDRIKREWTARGTVDDVGSFLGEQCNEDHELIAGLWKNIEPSVPYLYAEDEEGFWEANPFYDDDSWKTPLEKKRDEKKTATSDKEISAVAGPDNAFTKTLGDFKKDLDSQPDGSEYMFNNVLFRKWNGKWVNVNKLKKQQADVEKSPNPSGLRVVGKKQP